MEKFTKSSDDYLEAIYVLTNEKKAPVRNADVAAYLCYKAPSVSSI